MKPTLENLLDSTVFQQDLQDALSDLNLELLEPEELYHGLKVMSDKGESDRAIIKFNDDESVVSIIKAGAESRKLYLNNYVSVYDAVTEKTEAEKRVERRERAKLRQKLIQDELARKQRNIELVASAYEKGIKQAHPYLTNKGLEPEDVDIDYRVGNVFGKSVLIYKFGDVFQCLSQGEKRFYGSTKGKYAIIGSGSPEYMTEGFADAITVNMATGSTVVIAGSKGAFKNLAQTFPDVVIVGDNDPKGIEGIESSGLKAILPPEGDIDDYRQAHGLEAVLEVITNSPPCKYVNGRPQAPILYDSDIKITLVSGVVGSGKSYQEALRILNGSGLYIYACHDIDSGIARYEELAKLAKEHDKPIPTPYYVNSRNDDNVNVREKWEMVRNEYKGGHAVVYITHKGLELLDFSDLGELPKLSIDEAPEPHIINRKPISDTNIVRMKLWFDCKVREINECTIIEIAGLNRAGHVFHDNLVNKHNFETQAFWWELDRVARLGTKRYFWIYKTYSAAEAPDVHQVAQCEILDAEIFRNFSEVRLLADDVENSTFALIMENTQGVQYDVERLTPRADVSPVGKIEKIIGITDNRMSKRKIEIKPKLCELVVDSLNEKVGLEGRNPLFLFNKSISERNEARRWLDERGLEHGSHTPNTHGKNDMQHHDVIVMMYALKPSPEEVAMYEYLGITTEQIIRWREHNPHMQNCFRGTLRKGEHGVLVFPDKASIDYFISRHKNTYGEDLSELVEYLDGEELAALFTNEKDGPKPKYGEEALPKALRNKMSLWRKDMPIDLLVKDKGIDIMKSSKKEAKAFCERLMRELSWEPYEMPAYPPIS